MEQGKNNKGVIALLVIIILILLTLVILVATETISFKNNNNSNNIIKEPIEDNASKYTINSMTKAKFDIFWDGTEHEIKITDGKLVIEDNTFSIPNEKIKYYYFNRYQCSHGTVLYYLTENGNIYITEMSANDNNLKIESLNNFKKLDYSNVTDIVVIPNDNYGKALDDVSGITDNVKEYLYALTNDETFKLDYQYRC